MTTDNFLHPAFSWKLYVFERTDTIEGGPRYSVKFDRVALVWHGSNRDKLVSDAEKFRMETIVKFDGIVSKKIKARKKAHKPIMDTENEDD